jgi:Cu2+-exporting ATPase
MDLIEHNFRSIVSVNSVALFFSVAGVMPPVFAATLHNLSTIIVGLRAFCAIEKIHQSASFS